jgi:hypothetical protein
MIDALQTAVADTKAMVETQIRMHREYGFEINHRGMFKYLYGEYRGTLKGTHPNIMWARFVYARLLKGQQVYGNSI